MATRLRAVKAGETVADDAPSTPKTVAEAVKTGDQRSQLVAMRARIASAIDEPNARGADLAALSRRLLEIAKEIDAIDARTADEKREGAAATRDGKFRSAAV